MTRIRPDPPGPTWKWLVGILVALAFSGGSAWLHHVAAQQDRMDDRQNALEANQAKQAAASGERMMRVETRLDGMQKSLDDVKQQVSDGQRQLNDKLDRLLEQRSH